MYEQHMPDHRQFSMSEIRDNILKNHKPNYRPLKPEMGQFTKLQTN